MWRVEVSCPEGEEEITMARFMAFEIAAADTEPACAKAWFASYDEALRCEKSLNGVVHAEPLQNWNAVWQAEWTATPIGDRLWLAPPWDESATPEGRIRLNMHPGTLFGNGDHPTTQMCLAALEQCITPGCIVVDVGCGSGLLLEAAKLLGASSALGCDLDFEAAKTAPTAFQGSVDAIATGCVDIVVANIQLGILEELLPDLRRVVRKGGRIILSGLLEDQESPILEEHEAHFQDGWACLILAV